MVCSFILYKGLFYPVTSFNWLGYMIIWCKIQVIIIPLPLKSIVLQKTEKKTWIKSKTKTKVKSCFRSFNGLCKVVIDILLIILYFYKIFPGGFPLDFRGYSPRIGGEIFVEKKVGEKVFFLSCLSPTPSQTLYNLKPPRSITNFPLKNILTFICYFSISNF